MPIKWRALKYLSSQFAGLQRAPYDRIIFTAAPDAVRPALVE